MNGSELRRLRHSFIINAINIMIKTGLIPRLITIHRLVYFIGLLLHKDNFGYEFTYRNDKHGVYSLLLQLHIDYLLLYGFIRYLYDSSNYGPFILITPVGYKSVVDTYYRKEDIAAVVLLFLRKISVSLLKVSLVLFLFKNNVSFLDNVFTIDKPSILELFLKYKPGQLILFLEAYSVLRDWQLYLDTINACKEPVGKELIKSILTSYIKVSKQYYKILEFVQTRFLEKNLFDKRYYSCDLIRYYSEDGIMFYIILRNDNQYSSPDWNGRLPKLIKVWLLDLSLTEWNYYIKELQDALDERLRSILGLKNLRLKQLKYQQYLKLKLLLKDMDKDIIDLKI